MAAVAEIVQELGTTNTYYYYLRLLRQWLGYNIMQLLFTFENGWVTYQNRLSYSCLGLEMDGRPTNIGKYLKNSTFLYFISASTILAYY